MFKRFLSTCQKKYISYLDLQNYRGETDRLTYYRDRLFISILVLTVLLGSIAYIPSAIVAIVLDKWFVFLIDTIAIAIIFFSFFYKSISLRTRKQVFTVNMFLLSFGLVLDLGLGGNGPILLYMLSVLVTLYNGTKSGVNMVILTALFYFIILFVKYFDILEIQFYVEGPFEGLVAVFLNNILFSLLTVYCVSFLIKHLNKALIKENELQHKLKEEHEITLLAKQKAEHSDKLKTAFLSNMSHEINTPMYGVLGATSLLKSNLDFDDNTLEYFDIIESNGNKLLEIFNNVIEVSKLESGIYSVAIGNVDFHNIVERLKDDFIADANEKDIELIFDVEIEEEFNLLSDATKIYVALKHLLHNALKFTKPNGLVNVWCRVLNSSQLEIGVKDTGIGIAKENIEKMHLPFYKVDIDNSSGLHGTGLGYTIAKAYVNNLGSQLEIVSALGQGTQVSFVLEDYK